MRILIVDDEVIIRTGLCTVIDWKELGLTLLEPAESAEEALERIPQEKPHIVLTDIRMSGMDGIALAQEIKKLLPDTEIVILTGYDDFAYAQQALRQGVADYLLKTSGPEEIIKAALKARQTIMDKWELLRNEQARTAAFRYQLLERVFEGRTGNDTDPAQVLNWLGERSKIDLPADGTCLMRVILVQATGWGEGHLADLLNGAADNMLSELLPSLSLVKGERITLVMRVDSANEGTGELERVVRRVGQTLKCTVFAAAGCIVARPQELHRSFREAEIIYSYRLLLGESGVYVLGDIASRSGGRTVCSQEEEKELSGILVSNNPVQLRQWVNRIVREQMDDGTVTPNSLQAYLQSVVFAGHRWLERAKGDGRASAPPATAYPFDTDPRPEAELFRILSSLMSAFHDTISDSRYTYMQRAIAYIRDRLDQHLTLQDVARFVHLTPNHFSEVFKKETGQSYIEFVMLERMRKAADVLSSTQMKIGEVAGAVGYEDIKYFSQQFKKYYGKTPSEFRQSPGS